MRAAPLVLCLLLLGSCGPSIEERKQYSELNVKGNQNCMRLFEAIRAKQDPHQMRRWSECRTEHLMPIDLWQFPNNQGPIRAHYEAMVEESDRVDEARVDMERTYQEFLAGRVTREEGQATYQTYSDELEALYKKWDKRKAEIGLPQGLCLDTPDGGRQCY